MHLLSFTNFLVAKLEDFDSHRFDERHKMLMTQHCKTLEYLLIMFKLLLAFGFYFANFRLLFLIKPYVSSGF